MGLSQFTLAIIGDMHFGGKKGFDGSCINVPESELNIQLGDLVNSGVDDEYHLAYKWIKKLKKPFTMVKGNHDNGRWNYYAKQMCMPEMSEQLVKHSETERLGMVIWKPMIWEEYHKSVLSLPRKTDWDQLPVNVQDHIVKLRDLTPAYYTFEAGGMLFICLDTSNWLLGEVQMKWLKAKVSSTEKAVVILGHHHFLPVGIVYDVTQLYERDFMRKLIIENKNIIAYFHGHAHKSQWWKYAQADIISTGYKECRSVTFKNSRVYGSILNNRKDSPKPFYPHYICAQCFQPGRVAYLEDETFKSSWDGCSSPCLAWNQPVNESVDIIWDMCLTEKISSMPHRLSFQIRNAGMCKLSIIAPDLDKTEQIIHPALDGQIITINIGSLAKGEIKAKLTSFGGWGYVAMGSTLEPDA